MKVLMTFLADNKIKLIPIRFSGCWLFSYNLNIPCFLIHCKSSSSAISLSATGMSVNLFPSTWRCQHTHIIDCFRKVVNVRHIKHIFISKNESLRGGNLSGGGAIFLAFILLFSLLLLKVFVVIRRLRDSHESLMTKLKSLWCCDL